MSPSAIGPKSEQLSGQESFSSYQSGDVALGRLRRNSWDVVCIKAAVPDHLTPVSRRFLAKAVSDHRNCTKLDRSICTAKVEAKALLLRRHIKLTELRVDGQ
jgi:hypothetical protein